MAAINITNVQVLDNPTKFTNPFQFEIEYECLYDLKDDLEWKLIYVGSAESEKYDQVLDSVLVGPVYAGGYRFVFQANPPDVSRLPTKDIVGVTVVFLSCSYNGEEFIRVGYYVNNEYEEEELRETPPATPQIEKLVRNILADKPRVTKWSINFDSTSGGVSMQVSIFLRRRPAHDRLPRASSSRNPRAASSSLTQTLFLSLSASNARLLPTDPGRRHRPCRHGCPDVARAARCYAYRLEGTTLIIPAVMYYCFEC